MPDLEKLNEWHRWLNSKDCKEGVLVPHGLWNFCLIDGARAVGWGRMLTRKNMLKVVEFYIQEKGGCLET